MTSRFSKTAFFILLGAAALRCIGLDRPLLGNFAVYQTAQAMISRFFIENHFSTWLYPQVNVLSNGKPGLLLLYYPVASFLAAVLHQITHLPLEILGRLQAIVFFLLASTYLYKLVKKTNDSRTAFFSLLIFAILPLTIIYGRSFQNEMATIFFSLFFLYQTLQAFELPGPGRIFLAAAGWTFVLLTRPNNLHLLAPVFFSLFFSDGPGLSFRRKSAVTAGVLFLGALLPAFWYWHLWKVTEETNNIYSTMFAQLAVRSSFISSLALSVDFYRDLLDMLMGLVLTPPGFTFGLWGIWIGIRHFKRYGFYLLWTLAFFAGALLIPRKLVDHNFYWLHFVVAFVPLVSAGLLDWVDRLEEKSKKSALLLFILAMAVISCRYSLNPAFVIPKSDQTIPALGKKLQAMTSKEKDRIVVQGTHSLLYYADRWGYTLSFTPKSEISDYLTSANWEKLSEKQWKERIEAGYQPSNQLEYLMKWEGATHLAVSDLPAFEAARDFAEYIRSHYPKIYEGPEGIVFQLTPLAPAASQS